MLDPAPRTLLLSAHAALSQTVLTTGGTMAEKVKLSKDGSSIDFVQSDSLPTSIKKFRQSPEIEGFYRFIFENDLQKEAYEILNRIIEARKMKKALDKKAAKEAARMEKAMAAEAVKKTKSSNKSLIAETANKSAKTLSLKTSSIKPLVKGSLTKVTSTKAPAAPLKAGKSQSKADIKAPVSKVKAASVVKASPVKAVAVKTVAKKPAAKAKSNAKTPKKKK
jgi:hypothetical protein